MRQLEEKILREGTVLPGGILKVGSFLNQQMDVPFLMEMGREIARLYADCRVTKVLTVEASGIAIAVAAAAALDTPAVFAKKHRSGNVSGDVYSARVHSFTHGTDHDILVASEYLKPEDRVLIVDDFLANGAALEGLLELTQQAGATAVGCAVAIEKGFQHGGDRLRERGIRVDSLAILERMEPEIVFRSL